MNCASSQLRQNETQTTQFLQPNNDGSVIDDLIGIAFGGKKKVGLGGLFGGK